MENRINEDNKNKQDPLIDESMLNTSLPLSCSLALLRLMSSWLACAEIKVQNSKLKVVSGACVMDFGAAVPSSNVLVPLV